MFRSPPPTACCCVVILWTGSTGVILAHMYPADQSDWTDFAQVLAAHGYQALTFDFRGFTESEGTSTEFAGTDLLAAYQFMSPRVSRIFIAGASRAEAAILVAAREDVAGIILISVPTSFGGIAVTESISHVRAPILFVTSAGDPLVGGQPEILYREAQREVDEGLLRPRSRHRHPVRAAWPGTPGADASLPCRQPANDAAAADRTLVRTQRAAHLIRMLCMPRLSSASSYPLQGEETVTETEESYIRLCEVPLTGLRRRLSWWGATMAGERRRGVIGKAWRTLLLGVAVIAVVFAIDSRRPAAMEYAELNAADLRMRPAHAGAATDSVAIAAIDDQSIATIGHWPWPRDRLARVIGALSGYKAAVVGVDILLTEPDDFDRDHRQLAVKLAEQGLSESAISDSLGPGNDAALAQAMSKQRSVILGYAFENHRYGESRASAVESGFTTVISSPPPMAYDEVLQAPDVSPDLMSARAYAPPIPILNQAARGSAFVDADSDFDGVMRSLPAVVRFQDRYCMPMFLALVSSYRDNANPILSLSKLGVGGVMIGNAHVPVDELGRMLISFRGPAGTFPRYSVADIVARRVPGSAEGQNRVAGDDCERSGGQGYDACRRRFSGSRSAGRCYRQYSEREGGAPLDCHGRRVAAGSVADRTRS